MQNKKNKKIQAPFHSVYQFRKARKGQPNPALGWLKNDILPTQNVI